MPVPPEYLYSPDTSVDLLAIPQDARVIFSVHADNGGTGWPHRQGRLDYDLKRIDAGFRQEQALQQWQMGDGQPYNQPASAYIKANLFVAGALRTGEQVVLLPRVQYLGRLVLRGIGTTEYGESAPYDSIVGGARSRVVGARLIQDGQEKLLFGTPFYLEQRLAS